MLLCHPSKINAAQNLQNMYFVFIKSDKFFSGKARISQDDQNES